MPTFRQRVAITVLVTILATALGALLGYVEGLYSVERLSAARLSQEVEQVSKEADRYLGESRLALAAMNASPYKPCDDEELVYFRALLFEAKYLKDVGRMHEGKIDCSVDLGRLSEARAVPAPDFILQDGTAIYKNLDVYRGDDEAVVTLQMGDSYVVFRSANLLQLGAERVHFTESVVDVATHRTGLLRGETLQIDPGLLVADGQNRLGDTFYATRCSTRGLTCVTGSILMPEAIHDQKIEIIVFMVIGGLSCGLLGMVVSIIYRRSRSMEQQLRRAIRADKLRVVYQPVVDLQTRRIVGAEALVRWTDEDGFSMSPEVFVKLAEERGFVTDITRLILRQCLHEFSDILRSCPGFRLNINVTVADLADHTFLPMLARTLEVAGVPTQCLGIEITEGGTARQQVAMDAILQLRRRGHRVYIDDFGTGYSSLAYLQELAIDAIKIDRAFTKAIGTEAVTVTILPQILSMAELLNLQVVVEGIETIEQARYFTAPGKRFLAQGWLFGRPLSSPEFHDLLAEDQKLAAADSTISVAEERASHQQAEHS
jgi:sensor c-di-GMP phosphodiesterase-like protein